MKKAEIYKVPALHLTIITLIFLNLGARFVNRDPRKTRFPFML